MQRSIIRFGRRREKMKVENAIIMAAGMSNRFVPLSYEVPKGLLRVRGEILIERQIRQLHEAGIFDITIVVGYKKEKFYYLEERYGVSIVINEDYYRYNNMSTLICVLDKLSSTYVCSSDNYFLENVFEQEVSNAYYAAVFEEGVTDEWCLFTGEDGKIQKVEIGGENAWYMMGHAYFSPEFSKKFKEILKREYCFKQSRKELWESIYIRHIDELPMYIKKYDSRIIREFDSLDELRLFDMVYQNNSGCDTMQDIAKKLSCRESEISELTTLEGGMTNKSFSFLCKGVRYVYRKAGEGTEELINRYDEKRSVLLAAELGIDAPLVAFDADTGSKITKYIEGAQPMDAKALCEKENLRDVAEVLYKLHHCGKDTKVSFDMFAKVEQYEKYIRKNGIALFDDYEEIKESVNQIRTAEKGEVSLVPCHNDPLCANWIRGKKGLYLIDWEYGGMNEALWDVADVVIETNMPKDVCEQFLNYYYRRKPTEEERRRFVVNKIYIDYLWALWGKTRVGIEGEVMEQYARERYARLERNLEELRSV